MFRFRSEIDASIAGDALSGRINFKFGTGNLVSDCDSIVHCVSFQELDGTRAPAP